MRCRVLAVREGGVVKKTTLSVRAISYQDNGLAREVYPRILRAIAEDYENGWFGEATPSMFWAVNFAVEGDSLIAMVTTE